MLKPRFEFGKDDKIIDNGKPDYSGIESREPVKPDYDYDIEDIDFSDVEVERDEPLDRFHKRMAELKSKREEREDEDLDFTLSDNDYLDEPDYLKTDTSMLDELIEASKPEEESKAAPKKKNSSLRNR